MLCVLLPVALLLVTAPALTTTTLEAETCTETYDVGGEAIHVLPCNSASGGFAVQGVDVSGEWIAFPLEVPQPIAFRDSLRSAGEEGVVRTHVVEYRRADTGVLVVADTLVTLPGSGIG